MTFVQSDTNEKEALMSADENLQDPRVRALRAAGEDRAADILEALAEGDQQQRQEQEQEQEQPKVGPPGIPLLSHDPAQRQAEAEGRLIGDRLMKSNIGQSWVSGGPLLGDQSTDR